jgi:hypothetical protein
MGVNFEFLSQRLGQVAHLVKFAGPFLMDPAEQLGGAKSLLTQPLTKNGQTFQVEFKKVGRHGSMVAKKSRRD